MRLTKLQIRSWVVPLGMPLYALGAALVVMGMTYLPLLLPEKALDLFAREDHIFEMLTAVYLFTAAMLFVVAWKRSRQLPHSQHHTWLKQLGYLGFGTIMFVSAGEEISWGQRLLGIETPEIVKEINVQDELTIHNLNVFQGEESILPFSLSQAFTAFAFLFGIIVPFLALISQPARHLLDKLVPIIPLGIGFFFAVNYVYQKAATRLLRLFPELYLHPTMEPAQGIHEIREHGYAIVFLWAALYIVFVMLAPAPKGVGAATTEPRDATLSGQ